MALTRDFKETVTARVQSDPAFAQALLDEAVTLFLNWQVWSRGGYGEPIRRLPAMRQQALLLTRARTCSRPARTAFDSVSRLIPSRSATSATRNSSSNKSEVSAIFCLLL